MRLDNFVHSVTVPAYSEGRYRACDAYRSTLRRVCQFHGSVHPRLDVVFTPCFLRGFQQCLFADNLSHNTVSFYMSTLRAIYALAVCQDRLPFDAGLFSCVFTGSVPTVKRAVSSDVVARLHAADLSAAPRLERCRDLFMLCVCLQGIPFVDMLHLRRNNLMGDILTYSRRKTDTVICVPVLEEAFEYLSRLVTPGSSTPYLLPEITSFGEDGHRQYKTALRRHNRQLKDLAAYLGITDKLTSYVARHTWATTAYHNGIEVPVVSQAMGHRTEGTTRVYLDTFGSDALRTANRVVFDAILRPICEGRVTDVREEVKKQVQDSAKQQPKQQSKQQPKRQSKQQAKPKRGVLVLPVPSVAKSKTKHFQTCRQQIRKEREEDKRKMSLF